MDDGARVPQSAGRPSAGGARHPDAEGRARLPRRGANAPDQDGCGPGVLPGAREGVAAHSRHHHRQDRRGPRRDGGLHRQRSGAAQPGDAHGQPRAPGRPAWAVGSRGTAAYCRDASHLSPDGRAAQRRNRAARDADGTRLPAGGERHAAGPPDSRPHHRQLHPGQRPRWPRPLRRLVSPAHGRDHRGEGPHHRAAVLGQVHLSRQQPRHQLLAGDDARAPGLVPEDASAGDARPARIGAVPLHLLRPGAAESQPRSDRLRRTADVCQLRDDAAHQAGHARGLDARLRGHVVARLSRLHVVQPQRPGADVRDLRQRRRDDDEAARGAARGRRPDQPRMVSPVAPVPGSAVVDAQQHQLHADRSAVGPAVRVVVP